MSRIADSTRAMLSALIFRSQRMVARRRNPNQPIHVGRSVLPQRLDRPVPIFHVESSHRSSFPPLNGAKHPDTPAPHATGPMHRASGMANAAHGDTWGPHRARPLWRQ